MALPPSANVAFLALAAVAVAACSSTSSTGGAGGGAGTAHALITKTPAPAGPCFLDPGQIPADPTFLIASTLALSCTETLPAAVVPGPCSGDGPLDWELCIAIPSADLVPGILALATAAGVVGGELVVDDCDYASDVAGTTGTLTITGGGDAPTAFSLAGTDTTLTEYAVPVTVASDGAYTPLSCP